MTEAVETSTFMEGAAGKRSAPGPAPWKPRPRTSTPTPVEAPPKVEVEEDVRPPQEQQQLQRRRSDSEVLTPVQKDKDDDEARRRMALFQAQRLLLAARPFDSIEYFYVHQELKYYLRLGEDEGDDGQEGGGGWWRWITALLCGGDAARGRSTTASILV